MSMRLTCSLSTNSPGDYVVVAPQAADILSVALRTAYAQTTAEQDPFDDLIARLDQVAATPSR